VPRNISESSAWQGAISFATLEIQWIWVNLGKEVEAILYGKRLPGALYLYREEGVSFGEKLDALLTGSRPQSGL
jgi:hypothetical protein